MDKQYIIDEIKRTAAGNHGVPLGRDRFLSETGIRESDWSGRYWARWGDAVREAGFEPNTLQKSFDQDELIQHLVYLIRELGRFPTQAELRLRKRDDASFPTFSLWWSRFGTKAALAQAAINFCSARPNLAEIAAICAPIVKAEKSNRDTSIAKMEADFGYVYLIRSGRYYKIGRSNSSGRRKYELAIQLPEKVNMVHEIKTDDPVGIEAYWHTRFAAQRKNGEWFDLAAADIVAFKRRKFM